MQTLRSFPITIWWTMRCSPHSPPQIAHFSITALNAPPSEGR